MTATYDGLEFKTALIAQWAAFFDLAGWSWRVNPSPIGNWSPDFRVTFPCGHSECGGSHTLLISVLPIANIGDFTGHPCQSFPYGDDYSGTVIAADASAAFGNSPKVTRWEMVHGAGGGQESVESWVDNAEALWVRAGDLVA